MLKRNYFRHALFILNISIYVFPPLFKNLNDINKNRQGNNLISNCFPAHDK